MLSNEILDTSLIDKCFINEIDEISILTSVVIDNTNYGKYDIMCLKLYGTVIVLPIVLSYNKINDVIEIQIGDVLKFPDIYSLNSSIEVLDIYYDDNIPGILSSTDNQKVNSELIKLTKNSKISTTALPKLSITLPSVKVDESAGTITF